MAKKEPKKEFTFSKVGELMDQISKIIPITIEKEVKEKHFISTGIYLLDASLSGNGILNGGIQSNRITTFAGESGSGKSFLAYSVSKNAQNDGYSVIYIDTERAIDLGDFPKFGVDISHDKFRLIRSNKIENISMVLTKLIDELKNQKIGGFEIPKILIVMDSIGQLASNKEKEDLLNSNSKADFTKSKAIGTMLRSITDDLGYLEIPMLVCNHTYLTMDMFPTEKLKGGNALLYSSSVIGFMTKSKLKDQSEIDEMDLGASGITVLFKASKNRLAKPKKIRFDISFASGLNRFSGLDSFCRPEYFDSVGIAQGKMEVNKKTGEMTFTPGGNKWYVSHLDKYVTTRQLLTKEVFTDTVLKSLDPIISDYFRYKSIDELEKIEKDFNEMIEEEEDASVDIENLNADDLLK